VSFVLDNSVTMHWFFGDGSVRDMDYATAVLNAMASSTVLVPGIWALKVANVLARSEAKALASEARSEAFVGMLRRMDIAADRETNSRALSDTLHVARHDQLSSYDAAYLELALRTALPIATLDEELLRAAERAGVVRFAGGHAA
jgi:predicted nucleic acid-binding protein